MRALPLDMNPTTNLTRRFAGETIEAYYRRMLVEIRTVATWRRNRR